MKREIFIIGIGGQGALTIGEIISHAANIKNYAVSFYPFYGSQMRGGEAGCIVKIDTDGTEILNPTINSPDDFLILDDKFYEKYKIYENKNSKVYRIKDTYDKNLNLLLLKKYIDESKLFDETTMLDAIKEKFKREEVYIKKIEIYKNEYKL